MDIPKPVLVIGQRSGERSSSVPKFDFAVVHKHSSISSFYAATDRSQSKLEFTRKTSKFELHEIVEITCTRVREGQLSLHIRIFVSQGYLRIHADNANSSSLFLSLLQNYCRHFNSSCHSIAIFFLSM